MDTQSMKMKKCNPSFPDSNVRKNENCKDKTSNQHPKNLSHNAYYF